MEEFRSNVTTLLDADLKINESFVHKTASLFYSLEKMTLESLFARQMDLHGQATILFPSLLNSSIPQQSIVFIRVNLLQFLSFRIILILKIIIERLATGDSRMSSSRSLSIVLLDEKGEKISLKINEDDPLELIIPRDPNLFIPPMFSINVTRINQNLARARFYFQTVDFQRTTNDRSVSFHLEMRPSISNRSYLFVYQLGLITSWKQFNRWKFFCPQSINQTRLFSS